MSDRFTRPLIDTVSFSTIAADGPRAFPIREAFARIGVGHVTGYGLIASGELESFLIGRKRFATAEAVGSFLQRCIEKSRQDNAATRSRKVRSAVAASLASRGVGAAT